MTWLTDKIDEHKQKAEDARMTGECQKKLNLPKHGKGKDYDIDGVKGDQQDVICCVLTKLREWLDCSSISDPAQAKKFTPMRLTVTGAAGSGKSFLINTLVTVLRKMFDYDDVVHVAGPTGAFKEAAIAGSMLCVTKKCLTQFFKPPPCWQQALLRTTS